MGVRSIRCMYSGTREYCHRFTFTTTLMFFMIGAHLPGIHGTGQCERAGEASVLALDAKEVLLLLFFLDLALAMDGERVVLDADINVFLVDTWDFKLQSNAVLVFVDVHRRCVASGS